MTKLTLPALTAAAAIALSSQASGATFTFGGSLSDDNRAFDSFFYNMDELALGQPQRQHQGFSKTYPFHWIGANGKPSPIGYYPTETTTQTTENSLKIVGYKTIDFGIQPVYKDEHDMGQSFVDVPDASSYGIAQFAQDGASYTTIGGGAQNVEIRNAQDLDAYMRDNGITSVKEAVEATEGTALDLALDSVDKNSPYIDGFAARLTPDLMKVRVQFGFPVDENTISVEAAGTQIEGFRLETSGYTILDKEAEIIASHALTSGDEITAIARSQHFNPEENPEHYVAYTFANDVDLSALFEQTQESKARITTSPEISLTPRAQAIEATTEQRAAIMASQCLMDSDVAGMDLHEVHTTTGLKYPYPHVFVNKNGSDNLVDWHIIGGDYVEKLAGQEWSQADISDSIRSNSIENHTIASCAGSYKQQYTSTSGTSPIFGTTTTTLMTSFFGTPPDGDKTPYGWTPHGWTPQDETPAPIPVPPAGLLLGSVVGAGLARRKIAQGASTVREALLHAAKNPSQALQDGVTSIRQDAAAIGERIQNVSRNIQRLATDPAAREALLVKSADIISNTHATAKSMIENAATSTQAGFARAVTNIADYKASQIKNAAKYAPAALAKRFG